MNEVISKVGIHCVGPRRDGYGAFLMRVHEAGRRVPLIKCRDDFGAIDEPLASWPETITVGARTDWDDAGYSVDEAYNRIVGMAQLNPGIKYWEYYNERAGDWMQQADLYLALMPRLEAIGLHLCLFNCASGTPPYASEDGGVAYREIARACVRAKPGGHILGLHEYVSAGGTIGRFQVLADYLEAQNALIPIAITEFGFETHPGDAQLLQMVQTNDPLYMADERVIGCATWTLGGGGWGGSNFQTALPALGDYMATVDPIAPPPPSEPLYEFDYWELDGTRVEGNPLIITMNRSHTLTPHAKKKLVPPPSLFELIINPCPEYAGLNVRVNPDGLVYIAGTPVTCEAIL